MARVTPYAYIPASTPLHRAHALWKLVGLLLLSLAPFAFGALGLVAAVAATVAAAAVARIPPRRLFAGSLPLIVATLFVVVLRAVVLAPGDSPARLVVIDAAGLREGLRFALGLLAAFAGGAVLFATTTSAELREAVSRAEEWITAPLARALRRLPWAPCRRAASRLERSNLALVFALTLGFLPRVFEVWEAAAEARAARLGRKGPLGIAAVTPLAIERLMEMAVETARAMEARGATLGRSYPEREAKMRASSGAAATEE